MKDKYKDPLKIDIKETTKTIIGAGLLLGLGIPLVESVSKFFGGSE